MKVKNDMELEDWILLVVGLLAVYGLLVNGGFTGMAIYKNDFNGPAYSASGYYGDRVSGLKGSYSPEGVTAAERCSVENSIQMKEQCCREACSWDTLCNDACDQLVGHNS